MAKPVSSKRTIKRPAKRPAQRPAKAASPRGPLRPKPARDPWAEEAEVPERAPSVKITPRRAPAGKGAGSTMARNTGPWKPAAKPRPRPAGSVKGDAVRPAPRPAKAQASVSGLKPRAKAPAGERLQKILAAAGVASRRACEAIIVEGRVQVNGVTVTELGTRADPRKDDITLDFQPIAKEDPVYILLNKPKGYVTTVKDDEGRPTVMALLHGIGARVYPVGRLDFNSEGMLLLTNDGAMAQRLMAPEFHVAKVYLAKVHRMPAPETLDEFRAGFRLDGRRLKPCAIEVAEKGENPWLMVTLIEGKNQQIRRMFAAVGHPVSKLRRIQFGPLADPALKPGEWRFCNPQELAALKAL